MRIWHETITGPAWTNTGDPTFDEVLNAFSGQVELEGGVLVDDKPQYRPFLSIEGQVIHSALMSYWAVDQVSYRRVIEDLIDANEDRQAAAGFRRGPEDLQEALEGQLPEEDDEYDS